MTQKTLHFERNCRKVANRLLLPGGRRWHSRSYFINYFEELMSAEHKSYIEYDAIMQDKKLSELLGIPELSDEEKNSP